MLSDRRLNLSLTTAFAWVFWAATIVCLTLTFIFYDWRMGVLAACSTGSAATLHIRSFFCAFVGQKRDAFLLGQEVERDRQRDLHSIR